METVISHPIYLCIKYGHSHTYIRNAFPTLQEKELILVGDDSESNTVLREIKLLTQVHPASNRGENKIQVWQMYFDVLWPNLFTYFL